MILLKGGEALTPEGWETVDVLTEGARIAKVARNLRDREATVVDVTGMLVGPGLVDLHTHLREPGQTWKEDIESGSKAAAAGGFTAVLAMPNTDPPIDNPGIASEVAARGIEVGVVGVAVAAAVTQGRAGYEPAPLESLYRSGVRVFTDDGDAVADESVLTEALSRLAGLPGAVLAQHAEDPDMAPHGQIHEGELSDRLGLEGIPAEAESSMVERDLAIVEITGGHYHCQHVSAAGTVDLIRLAKAKGLPVTAEVAPHHITFEVGALKGLDPDFKMYPPIRTGTDRTALREGVADRTIDVVATDHAPHGAAEKAVAFEDAPRGVIGLETAASAVFETFGDPSLLFEVLSSAPSRIGCFSRQGRPIASGGPANLVVFDPAARWVAATFASRSSNSPYLGREMVGRVMATIFDGRLTFNALGHGASLEEVTS